MEKYTGLEIAVIGMSGRFPKAENIAQYWENLKNGKDCISTFSMEEALEEGEDPALVNDPHYVKANAYLSDKQYFDASFFGYREAEAALMDPQMRIFHECCWEALEDSGYDVTEVKFRIGLFAGGAANFDWEAYAMLRNEDNIVDDFTATRLRKISHLCSRVSYKLNLKGPSVFLQTGCSTSLIAIHQACNSLLLGECSIALAGGVAVANHSKKGYIYEEGMILSKDGKCRPFDTASSGTVPGEGAGVVVLKKLKDAMKDRDHIYAIVKGTGINNDGNEKVGYTAPSIAGQAAAIRMAHKMAGVKPAEISYVEAHGTATKLGDPVELAALNDAFDGDTSKYCAIGSVKSNFGHLDIAAGVAGFIKAVLATKYRILPPSLHYNTSNPDIPFDKGPFYVNNQLKDWETPALPLRAGVSSFGIGGTNVHVVLEEAPAEEGDAVSREYLLMVISARTKGGLERNVRRLADYLKQNNRVVLADIASTLKRGRARFEHRFMFVCNNSRDAVNMLSSDITPYMVSAEPREELQHIVFMFSGQGTQYVDMYKNLYLQERRFRERVDECLQIASTFTKEDLREILFPVAGAEDKVNITKYTQPLLFIVEYSLAALLMEWGIKPDYMIGHSIGEYVAACISGVLSVTDAVKLVIKRGELMNAVEKGSMLSLNMTEEQLEPFLGDYVNMDLAAVNSENALVVSGKETDIQLLERKIVEDGRQGKVLYTSHAFHSHMMDDILEAFEREVEKVTIYEPVIPYVSNVTGKIATYDDLRKSSYWSRHLRTTVQFKKGIEFLLSQGNATLIELGPGRSLCNYAGESTLKTRGHKLVNMVRHIRQQVNDQQYLTEKVGQLWLAGVKIDWDAYYRGEKRKKVSLPTYAFERVPYMTDIDAYKLLTTRLQQDKSGGLLYVPFWKSSTLPGTFTIPQSSKHTCIVFRGEETLSAHIVLKLKEKGINLIEVKPEDRFKDLSLLWEDVDNAGTVINTIIYCKGLNATYVEPAYEKLKEDLDSGFIGLATLGKSLSARALEHKPNIIVVDNQLAMIMGDDKVNPLKAAVIAPAKILPSEMPGISAKVIDVPYPFRNEEEAADYSEKLINEFFYASDEPFIAYRYGQRWERSFESVSVDTTLTSNIQITEGGVYIVAGGFGGMGRTLAGELAKNKLAKVILLGRTTVPPEASWSNVQCYQVDLTDEAQVKACLDVIMREYPRINGLIWSAGEVDYGGIMLNRSEEELLKYTRSKIHGLLLVEKYLDFRFLDFLALFSSIGNVLYETKFGQVSYNAANEFMEAYASYSRKKWNIHAFAINWSDWLDVGMTVKMLTKKYGTEDLSIINKEIGNGILPAEGIELFKRCLKYPSAGFTVFRGNLNMAIKERRREYKEIVKESDTAIVIQNEYEDVNDRERQLINIFTDFFGQNTITVKDNFFEMGGDSLRAMTLIARINRVFGTKLPISYIYKYPTIESLLQELPVSTEEVTGLHITKAPVARDYCLSSAQSRMYFLQRLDMDAIRYNETLIIRMEGELDRQKIQDAFVALIRRHEVLRTRFVFEGEKPRQVVVSECPFRIKYINDFSGNEKEMVRGLIRPLALDQAPMIEVTIIEDTDNRYLMVLNSHHIVMDGVSKQVLIRDLVSLYNGVALPELKLQYKDYAEWQQSKEVQEIIREHKQFWLQEFEELPLQLNLPLDFERPLQRSYEGKVLDFRSSIQETAALKAMAEEQNASMFMVLLSLYSVLLGRLSNQDEITIGVPAAGRDHADLEDVIGMFVNTLVLCVHPEEDITYSELLAAVKSKALSCYDKQAYQYEELVNELKIDRNSNRTPLFDVMFMYDNFQEMELEVSGMNIIPYKAEYVTSKFDMTLIAYEDNEQLCFRMEYATELFKESTMLRIVEYFRKIMTSVTNNPDILIKNTL